MAEHFDLILADPPWRYDFARSNSRRVENQYATMHVHTIGALQVPAAANCILYLWATAPKVPEALWVMTAWGFTYKTHAVWLKRRLGMGYWFRNRHELLLVGTRGLMSPPAPRLRTPSLIQGEHGAHSEKPDSVYEMLERQHPDLKKVELFARTARPGWANWGNELPTTLTLTASQ